MKRSLPTRREFLRTGGRLFAAGAAPAFLATRGEPLAGAALRSLNERPGLAAIGVGDRGMPIANQARRYADVVAVADVDDEHGARAGRRLGEGRAEVSRDHRRALDRKDVDVVTIGTPDHWHAKIAIEALQAGKDVYCEKPLALTIDEGKMVCEAVRKTGRVFQVGTQQRSEMGSRFLQAVALCHAGRLGKIRKVTCAIGASPSGGPFEETDPPPHLDWDRWLGQAPLVSYMKERCHGTFRWWYEYAGGKVTDWGAHHVDIAHWALEAAKTGPVRVEGTATHPGIPNGFNTATAFRVACRFATGAEIIIAHRTDQFSNGILIEGERGRLYVDRGRIDTSGVQGLADDPLPAGALRKVYGGKEPGSHMRNFFECVRTREQPISDVYSHHRALTTCHLANICIRLGRPIRWDPETEQISGDDEAAGWLKRPRRKGYEISPL